MDDSHCSAHASHNSQTYKEVHDRFHTREVRPEHLVPPLVLAFPNCNNLKVQTVNNNLTTFLTNSRPFVVLT